MLSHEIFMQRCIQIALLGEGKVSPNPLVGAVLVYNGEVIGEGYHKAYGQPHAEVECIKSVKPEHEYLIEKSALYVSLEPCAHFGKTPPCANLIVEKKIKQVVIGALDTTEKVNGKGVSLLQKAGIEVIVGVLERECIRLNKHFFYAAKHYRPFITAKWAQSRDGFVNTNDDERAFISNKYTQRFVHKIRMQHQAILVGSKTIEIDNPFLDTRFWNKSNKPIIIVIDKNLSLPISKFNISKSAHLIIVNIKEEKKEANIHYLKVASEIALFEFEICKRLFELNIHNVLIEGGAFTINRFLEVGLVSAAIQIVNHKLTLQQGKAAPDCSTMHLKYKFNLANDDVNIFTAN